MNYKVNKFNIILTREFETLEEKEIKKILLETVKRLVVETSVEQTGVTN